MGQNGDHWINGTQSSYCTRCTDVSHETLGAEHSIRRCFILLFGDSIIEFKGCDSVGSCADCRNGIRVADRRPCRCRCKLPRSAKTKQGCQNWWGGTWFLDLICANRQWFRSVVPWRVPVSQWLSLQGWRCLCNFLAADCHLPCVLIIIRMFEVPVVPLLP